MSGTDEELSTGRVGTTVLLLACFWSIGLLYTPTVLYLGNAGEFTLLLSELLSYTVPIFIGAWAVSSAGAMLLRPVMHRHAIAAFAALSFLAWLQGHVLLWHSGVLDGRAIDWAEFRVQAFVDGALWVVVLAFALRKSSQVYGAARMIAVGLFLVQAVGLMTSGSEYRSRSDAGAVRKHRIDTSTKFVLSTGRNAMVIILDELQSDITQEVLNEDETLSASFDGFVYFRNAVSAASRTELAVPAMLTGRVYDNTIPRSEYLSNAYLEHSIFRKLKERDFLVDVHPWVGWGNESIFLDERIASNVTKRVKGPEETSAFTEKKAKEVLHLLDVTLFRCLPQVVKPYIYNDYKWFLVQIVPGLLPERVKTSVSSDHEFETSVFVKEFREKLEVREIRDTFKYYHLKGAHHPLTVDADRMVLGDTVYPYNRRNYKAQVTESLRALARLFELLRQRGAYENSLVVVIGDHGSGKTKGTYLNPSGENRVPFALEPFETSQSFHGDKSKGVPAIMIKRIGSSGGLGVSRAPVSSIDLPATIASELGLETASGEVSMFERGVDAERVRYFRSFSWQANRSSYVSDLTVYQVIGDSWLDTSWKLYALESPMGGGEPSAPN